MRKTALLAISVSTVSFAETAVEEIVVTASHFALATAETASTVTLIDRAQIERRAALTLSDLLRDVPGMAISRSGVLGSQTDIRVRGAEANHLLVLVDGVEVNDPSQDDGLNWANISANDIERIEVVRGSQSAIYGSDALAGVVNIITRQADKPLRAELYAEAGSNHTTNGGVSLGVSGDRYGLRLGLSRTESDGENISRSGSEKDGYENSAANLKGHWQLNDKMTLQLAGRYSDGESQYDNDSDWDGRVDDTASYSEFTNHSISLRADYQSTEGWQHRLTLAQTDNDNKNFPYGFADGSTAAVKDQVKWQSAYSWLGNRLTAMVEREREDFQQRGIAFESWGSLYDPNQDRKRDTDSLALEYRGQLSDDFTLALAARRDSNSEFDDSDSWRWEAIYQASDLLRLRASWATAVKNPTFAERFGYYNNFIGNPDLQPEEAVNRELGADLSLLDQRLNIALSLFDSDLENEINGFVWHNELFGFTSANMPGKSQRKGAELEMDAQLTDDLQLAFAYSYIDATQDDGYAESIELRRPRHSASLNLAWVPAADWQLNLNAQHSGRQYDTDWGAWPAQRVVLDDYTLLNLNLNYQLNESLSLYIKLENALDEAYEEVFSYNTLGRTAAAGFRYQFGK